MKFCISAFHAAERQPKRSHEHSTHGRPPGAQAATQIRISLFRGSPKARRLLFWFLYQILLPQFPAHPQWRATPSGPDPELVLVYVLLVCVRIRPVLIRHLTESDTNISPEDAASSHETDELMNFHPGGSPSRQKNPRRMFTSSRPIPRTRHLVPNV